MLEFALPPPRDEILFEAVLEPTGAALKKLEMKRGMGEGEIATFLGKVNKVAVGVPYCENLISRCAEQAIELPHEIEKLADKYDFYFVSLSYYSLALNSWNHALKYFLKNGDRTGRIKMLYKSW